MKLYELLETASENKTFTVKDNLDLIAKALEILEDQETFCDMVEELDYWNGYADGYRCWNMEDLSDFYLDRKATDLLNDIVQGSFDYTDDYFYYSIYGLESTDNKWLLYSDNFDIGDVLDEIIDNASHLHFSNKELEETIDNIIELRG